MFGNLLFGVTALAYILLAIFNLQRVNVSGERLMGWGMIAVALIAIYIVFSLMLTMSIAAKGGFNWISSSTIQRNAGVGILWLGMVVGVSFCTIIRPELRTDQTTGLVRFFSIPVYFGAVWLPLLMLVPYAILLRPEWRDSLSPNLYKVPLILGCALGLFIVMLPNIVRATKSFNTPQTRDESQLAFDQSMSIIANDNDSTILGLLYFTHKTQDKQLRNAAIAKIKTHANWEDDLIQILEQNGYTDIYWVYAFLEGNKVEHPERFIEPIKTSIVVLTSEIQETMKDPNKNNLGYINIDDLCHVLDDQFRDSHDVFRPSMLKLQEALEAIPATRQGDGVEQHFGDTLNEYRTYVKNWLNEH
jgi:hypothetical protein